MLTAPLVEDARNLVTNPSAEVNAGGGWAAGATRSTVRAWRGAASFLLKPDSTGCYNLTNLLPNKTYTASAYVWIPAAETAGVVPRIGSSAVSPAFSGSVITARDQWTRVVMTFTTDADAGNLAFYPALVGTVDRWADGVMIVEGDVPHDYFDGSSPDTADVEYSWAGAPHASQSIRMVRPEGSDLGEMHFELLPSIDATEGQTFGIGLDVSIDGDGGFDPGETSFQSQTSISSRRGHRQFGRDVLSPPAWAFSMHVNTDSTDEAAEALERFVTAWRGDDDIRDDAGAVMPLRYRLAGRTRRVFGRPSRLAAPPSNMILSGFVPITAEFEPVDSYTYADTVSSIKLDLAAANQGGFIFPVTFPVSTLPPGVAAAPAYGVVGGTAKTYPVIKFEGPWEDPTLITPDWTLALTGSLASGDVVVIDTRPWSMSVTRNGTPTPGMLRRRTYLEDLYLRPGTTKFELGGNSTVGGAACTVRWHSAFNSI